MRGRGITDTRGETVGISMIRSSMMDRGGKKGSRDISIIMGNISRCMYFCSILLRNMISINSFRSSMRLANYRCYFSKVKFKHKGRDRRNISKLDGLILSFINSFLGQKSRAD